MKDFLVIFIGAVIGAILFLFALSVLLDPVFSKSCAEKAKVLQVTDYDYGYWSGCNFEVREGVWIDSDDYGAYILLDK